ncbi:MAG: hypothetical protein KF773_41945 [Deltaproteobacteria bacterium]|nr:hypothetical protein [Deltaproteobacteria bacterium]
MGAPAGPPKKLSKGMLIGLAASGGALVVITVVVLLLNSGGGAKGGASDRDELARETLALIEKGDVDGMLRLTGGEDFDDKIVDCERKKSSTGKRASRDDDEDDYDRKRADKFDKYDRYDDKDRDRDRFDKFGDEEYMRDPRRKRDRMPREFEKIVDKAKGARIELVEVEERGKPSVWEKGDRVRRGCTARTAISIYTLRVIIKVTPEKAEKAGREQKVELRAIEADNKWYLLAAPKVKSVPDCTRAMGNAVALSRSRLKKSANVDDAALTKLEERWTGLCGDDNWSEEAVNCYADAVVEYETMRCQDKLTPSQREKMAKELVQSVLPSSKGDPLAASLPYECVEYRRVAEELLACTKVDPLTRDTARRSLDAMKDLWSGYGTMSSTQQRSIADSCTMSAASTRRTSRTNGC